jgi:hypothetical protein
VVGNRVFFTFFGISGISPSTPKKWSTGHDRPMTKFWDVTVDTKKWSTGHDRPMTKFWDVTVDTKKLSGWRRNSVAVTTKKLVGGIAQPKLSCQFSGWSKIWSPPSTQFRCDPD